MLLTVVHVAGTLLAVLVAVLLSFRWQRKQVREYAVKSLLQTLLCLTA
jgi:ABC-type phosphate/phosphonate transport system permease subunit